MKPKLFAPKAIVDSFAVLGVTDQWVRNSLQVAADLVLPSRFNLGLDEAVASRRKFADRDRDLRTSERFDSGECLLRLRIRDISKRIVLF